MAIHGPTQNFTLTLPSGTKISDHGDPHLLCRSARWTDIAAFYLGNYIAHVATVRSKPGELTSSLVCTLYCALISPTIGVTRGMSAIRSFTAYYVLQHQPLRAAARAGALCMIVRDEDWKPAPSDNHKLSHVLLSQEYLSQPLDSFEVTNDEPSTPLHDDLEMRQMQPDRQPSGSKRITLYHPSWAAPTNTDLDGMGRPKFYLELTRNFHGSFKLPPGYTLTQVPTDAVIDFLELEQQAPNQCPTSASIIHGHTNLQIAGEHHDDLNDGHPASSTPPSPVDNVPPNDANTTSGHSSQTSVKSTNTPPEEVRPAQVYAEQVAGPAPDLAYTWSFVKGVVSVLQFLYAVSSLYRTRGDQINTYGYAAFGLTVAPYAVMSFVNLISNMVAVEFPKLYLVDSPIMQEAIERGGRFAGVVGRLRPTEAPTSSAVFVDGPLRRSQQGAVTFTLSQDYQDRQDHQEHRDAQRQDLGTEPRPGVLAVPTCAPFERTEMPQPKRRGVSRMTCLSFIPRFADWRLITSDGFEDVKKGDQVRKVLFWPELSAMDTVFLGIMLYLPIVASLSIVGGLSGFHARRSTRAERVWTMMWLVLGFVVNSAIVKFSEPAEPQSFGESAFFRNDGVIRFIARRLIHSESATEGKITRFDVNERFQEIFLAMFYSAPAIGGFVVVGQMLRRYGECFRVF